MTRSPTGPHLSTHMGDMTMLQDATPEPDEVDPPRASRRTVATAAIWTTPVVVAAVDAPAFAVSCDGITPVSLPLNSGNYARSSNASATWTPLSTLTVGLSAVAVGGTSLGIPGVLNNLSRSVDGIGLGNTINSTNGTPTSAQILTLTFSQPVSNLSFRIGDIDCASGQFKDVFYFSATATRTDSNTQVIGTGSGSGDPIRQTGACTGYNPGDAGGAATVNIAGPITSLTITYYSSTPNTNMTQAIYLSNFFAAICG